MKPSPRYLVIPENGRQEISQLLSLSAKQLRLIAETLRSTDTLKFKEASYRRVASKADITNEESLAILSAITNLIIQRKRYNLDDEKLLEELAILFGEKIGNMDNETQYALIDLLSETDEGYIVEKAEVLKSGFAPHVVSMRSICDVRPVFDKDRKTIKGILIVASLGITTHDENHRDQTVVIQMTQDDLEKLRELIVETQGKMSIMQNEFGERFDVFS